MSRRVPLPWPEDAWPEGLSTPMEALGEVYAMALDSSRLSGVPLAVREVGAVEFYIGSVEANGHNDLIGNIGVSGTRRLLRDAIKGLTRLNLCEEHDIANRFRSFLRSAPGPLASLLTLSDRVAKKLEALDQQIFQCREDGADFWRDHAHRYQGKVRDHVEAIFTMPRRKPPSRRHLAGYLWVASYPDRRHVERAQYQQELAQYLHG